MKFTVKPEARTDGIIIRRLADETIIYNTENHEAKCLNSIATKIWDHCDGSLSLSEIAARSDGVDEDAVADIVGDLAAHELVAVQTDRAFQKRLTRRQQLMGMAGASAVITMTASTVWAQASPVLCGSSAGNSGVDNCVSAFGGTEECWQCQAIGGTGGQKICVFNDSQADNEACCGIPGANC